MLCHSKGIWPYPTHSLTVCHAHEMYVWRRLGYLYVVSVCCVFGESNEITHQIERDPYPGGTDAYAMQICREGIPAGLLSIPLRNMHTTVELLHPNDIKRLGELLSVFISQLDSKFQEDLKCF